MYYLYVKKVSRKFSTSKNKYLNGKLIDYYFTVKKTAIVAQLVAHLHVVGEVIGLNLGLPPRHN